MKIIKESNISSDLLSELYKTIKSDGVDSINEVVNGIVSSIKAHSDLKGFEEYSGPNSANLPDGRKPYTKYIDELECNIEVNGDINREDKESVFVTLDAEEGDVLYYLGFNYYTEFHSAVALANKLVKGLESCKSTEDIKKLCKSSQMVEEHY